MNEEWIDGVLDEITKPSRSDRKGLIKWFSDDPTGIVTIELR